MNELEKKTRKRMQKIADAVQKQVPDNFGFIVLTYEHGKKGHMLYVSNSQREDVVKAMKEFIANDEKEYGKDAE